MIEIKINNEKEVVALLERVAEGIRYNVPLMRTIAGTMQSAVDQNFEAGGRPKWLGVKSRPDGSPLIDSGALRNSIHASWDNDEAQVGTNLKYAAIHQFGGKTKPHKIKPVTKKALAFGGIVRKSVNHPGSTIQARPFLVLTPQDEADILDDVQHYFQSLMK
ncbi:phage virion morphogenesis protein [Rodentibacter trehalosifermentans]|uniref:Phage virion morphogenesis protein n=1 Tax=Rodentibacter trehalosifermentans TaxID=1908263 RepID=A0A1V3IUA4_9PAST|nr:phage virion morphogenesis protein [Rodentibacter trehalosifermentans]OOF45620.1 phage virion morphogenesis protein [Rodentibacter trehalosifermentans]